MKKNLLSVLSILLIATFVISSLGSPATVQAAPPPGHCFPGEDTIKDENGSNGWSITAPAGRIFTDARIKAGTECYDAVAGCYTLTGIGTSIVTATRIGDGPGCKEISHLEGVIDDAPPPPPPPASASVQVGACDPEVGTSPVTFTTDHAVITTSHDGSVTGGIYWPPAGDYVAPWTADPGFTNSGILNYTVETCTEPPPLGEANVSISLSCVYDAEGQVSQGKVTVTPTHAEVLGLPISPITTLTIATWDLGSYSYTWTALPEYSGSGAGTLVIDETCAPTPKSNWKPQCMGCVSPQGIIWENIFGKYVGGPAWDDDQLYGSGEEKTMTATVIEDCNDQKYGSHCDYDRWLLAIGRVGSPSEFAGVFDGVSFPAPAPHLGADGNNWILYMNPIGPPENRWKPGEIWNSRVPLENSLDGWLIEDTDGTLLNTPDLWKYSPCCLAASYAMTKKVGSTNYAIRYPGACQWSWVQFFVKSRHYTMPTDWAGWQAHFDANLSWYLEWKALPISESIAYPPTR